MDGSKMLFKDPASASTNGLAKVRKVQRGPLKKVAADNGVLSLQEENILGLLHNFLNQFLAGGYNVLMQTIRDDIIKEQQDIQKSDIITFFQVTHFVTAFHQKTILTKRQKMENMEQESSMNSQSVDYLSLHQDLCGPIAATMNEAMYFLVISKWREASDGVKITNDYKFLTAAGSLMKSMVRMLDLVMKLLPQDSKECQTARVLLYKLFYDQTDEGLTQFLMNRFKCFDSHKQPRSDLADLLEIIHIMFRLMEKLQDHGNLRVCKKIRRRVKKKASKDKIEVESELIKEVEIVHEHVESVSEMCIDLEKSVKEKDSELNSVEREHEFNQEGSLNLSPAVEPDIPLQNTEHPQNHSSAVQDDEENEKPDDHEYETSSSSNTEEPATNEVSFNISALVSSFASNTIIHKLCWLLKHYKANSASINHYILCMLSRFCEDLELSPMLYQLSLLVIFYDILAEQKTCKSREYMNIITFLNKFIRKMFKIMKSQPLLFVEILFWKTRRECQYFNAEVLMESIGNLRKDVRNMVGASTGAFVRHRDMGYRSIADALGEDEIDLDLPSMHHDQRAEHSSDSVEGNSDRAKRSHAKRSSVADTSENEINKDRSEITPFSPEAVGALRRDSYPNFSKEQDTIIHELYEKFKNERQCIRLIADAVDPAGKISPTFISRKLKQLGLMVVPKKKLVKANVPFPAPSDPTISGAAFNATTQHDLNNSENVFSPKISRRKRVRAFSEEEELQITILYEKFKSHKKRNVMIANALNPDKKFTAAQVSRKLKQLGLLPDNKSSSTSGKHKQGNEINEEKENSDEETLLAIRERSNRKKRVPEIHTTTMSTSPQAKAALQENYSDDLILSSYFKEASAKRKLKPSAQDQDGPEAIESEAWVLNSTPIEVGRGEPNQVSDMQVGHSDLEDSMDSGEDVGSVALRKVGARKRMVLDFEEDDDDD